jgi:hypothetical protein
MLGRLQSAPPSTFEGDTVKFASPATFVRHALHHPERDWPQTNCYVDLWIELLAAHGVAPEAMLGFTLTQDFEGDQFTFFKPPHADLEFLFGLRVDELAIYDRLENHIERQLALGRVVLAEVDGFYLPDTRGVTYRIAHSKTTIGIVRFDASTSQIDYFHNDGLYMLESNDFEGVLGRLPGQKREEYLFPYVEFTRLDQTRAGPGDIREKAEKLLRVHFARRPKENPLHAFADAFPQMWCVLENRPADFFNVLSFNTLRQLGANFELLGSHLDWLRKDGFFEAEIAECQLLSARAKALQFNVARAATRRRPMDPTPALAEMAATYDRLFAGMARAIEDRA